MSDRIKLLNIYRSIKYRQCLPITNMLFCLIPTLINSYANFREDKSRRVVRLDLDVFDEVLLLGLIDSGWILFDTSSSCIEHFRTRWYLKGKVLVFLLGVNVPRCFGRLQLGEMMRERLESSCHWWLYCFLGWQTLNVAIRSKWLRLQSLFESRYYSLRPT